MIAGAASGPVSPQTSSEKMPKKSGEKFCKSDKILKTGDFRKVYKKGLSVKEGTLLFYYLENRQRRNRLGISISSRNIRSAVARNRIKRILREVFRKNKKNTSNGYDIVVVIKRYPGEEKIYKNIEQAFLYFTRKVGIL